MDREPLPDYSSTIRAQIEREVIRARDRIEETYARAIRVDIGYITNSHRGQPLFRDGERLDGLPVRIDRSNLNGLTVRSTGEDVKLR